MLKREAAELATAILRKYWNGTLPIDVDEIAQKLGVKVIYRDEKGAITPPEGIAKKSTDDKYDVSGRFDIVNGQPYCTIRATDAKTRQRFTLAHELGHYLLGHGSGFRDNANSVDYFTNEQRAEVEANAFAAELIMPEIVINELITKFNIKNIMELANKLYVSDLAMKYRLKKLGWLP